MRPCDDLRPLPRASLESLHSTGVFTGVLLQPFLGNASLHLRQNVSVQRRVRWRLAIAASLGVIAALGALMPIGTAAEPRPDARQTTPSNQAAAPGGLEQEQPGDELATEGSDLMEVSGMVVDESGRPLADVRIWSSAPWAEGSATSGSDGGFSLRLKTMEPLHLPPLLAESADQARIGFIAPESANTLTAAADAHEDDGLRITLEPARTVHVTVGSADGSPVAGASVEAFSYTVSFPDSRTDAHGHAAIRVPPSAEIMWIVAFSDEFGFDYFENYRSRPAVVPVPVPDEVALTLHVPTEVRVQTVASQDRIEGALVFPHTISLPGRLRAVNLSMSSLAWQRTNAEGNCTFRWIPTEATGRVEFVPFRPGYHCPNFPRWDPNTPLDPVTIRFVPNAAVSGTVRFEDGSPAAGITILGEGRGVTGNFFRGSTRTRADGSYELSIYPDLWSIIALADREWAAPSHTDIQLGEGESRTDLDFQLTRGTRIRGRVTVGPDRQPVAGENVMLIEHGEGAVGPSPISLVRRAEVDQQGTYEFRVGPGKFELHLPNTHWEREAIAIDVDDQEELVYNHWTPRPHKMRITGRVVDQAGKPVADAIVHGEPVGDSGWAGFEATANDHGEFIVDRRADTDNYGYYARSPERNLAACKVVSSDEQNVAVELEPAATVVGYVFDTAGPVANRKVTAVVNGEREENIRINLQVLTDETGRYRIPALAVGSRCTITVEHGQEPRPRLDVELNRPGQIEPLEVLFLEP